MSVQSLFSALLAATLVSQVAAGATSAWTSSPGAMRGSKPAAANPTLPDPIVTKQRQFLIPFRVERSNDPSWRPVEAQLLVSTDRGMHWRVYSKAPTTQQRFPFHAGSDGEFWFAIRTLDRAGHVKPDRITAPGLRVIVDSAGNLPAQGEQNKTSVASSDTSSLKGPASVDINLASNKRSVDSGPAFSGLPAGERPRMVNSRSFELEYDIDSVGPSGVGQVQLWGTRDSGQTWRAFTSEHDSRGTVRVKVDEEGIYGFRLSVTNGVGVGGKRPEPGDAPDVWVGVDWTKPTARIVSAEPGVGNEAGKLIISWQADDQWLAARPISLFISDTAKGQWTPIATGMENTGRYAWPIDGRLPPKIYLRLEVRDEAGNVAMHETSEPVVIDQSHPVARIRGIRKGGQTTARPVWQPEQ
jgi:hypothetical protein